LPHARVQNQFEIAASVSVVENNRAECLAVNVRLGLVGGWGKEDLWAESFNHANARRPLVEQRMAYGVSVDNKRAVRG
jgi:hypothetical protein